MIKYLFNDKIQISTNKNFICSFENNLQKKYGDFELYDNVLNLGYLSICW